MTDRPVTVRVLMVGNNGLVECEVCGPIFVVSLPAESAVREHLTSVHTIRQSSGV